MAAAHQAQAGRDPGGRTGKTPLRGAASRTRRGQQSAPRALG
jgi:hypothetical protein